MKYVTEREREEGRVRGSGGDGESKRGKREKKRGETENYEPVPVSKWYLTRGLNIQKT